MATTAPLTPALIGYSLDRSPDLTDPEVRSQLSGSAIKAFVKITQRWKLSESQVCGLLGGVTQATYNVWKAEPKGRNLSQDTLIGISLVLGIYQDLHISFGDELADSWITSINRGSLFAGTSPLDYMIRQGQPGMIQVRRMLEAWSVGN